MKNLILKSLSFLAITLLFNGFGYAQKVNGNGNLIEKTRNVGSFNGLGVSGSFDVFLVEGNEGKLELSVEENLEPYLVTEVKEGSLKIKWKKGVKVRTTKPTKITVHFKKLNEVALAGSGDIVSKSRLSSDELEVALAGSGDIKLDLDVEMLKVAISGSGDIELTGSASDFSAAIAGSGDIKADELKAVNAELVISGSGTMKAHVENKITALVSGSGDIRYKGKPEKEDIKVSGSGTVKSY